MLLVVGEAIVIVEVSVMFVLLLAILCSATSGQLIDVSFSLYADVEKHTCVTTRPMLEVIQLRNACGSIFSPCYPQNYPTDVTEGFLLWNLNTSTPISAIRLTFHAFETNSLGGVLFIGRSLQTASNTFSITRDFRVFGSLTGDVSLKPFTFLAADGFPLNSSSRTYEITNVEPLFMSFYSSLAEPLSGFNISYCVDVDQCRTGKIGTCLNGGFCSRNSFNNYACSCPGNYSGSLCEADVDECEVGLHNCDANANCSNTNGSFLCACKIGFMGNGSACKDIDECLTSNICSPNSFCINTNGSHLCPCKTGFRMLGNNCIDINECNETNPCDTNALCINTQGSFTCTCNEGYRGDGLSCSGAYCRGNVTSATTCNVPGFLEWPTFRNSSIYYRVNELVTWHIDFTANSSVSAIRFTFLYLDVEREKDFIFFNNNTNYTVTGNVSNGQDFTFNTNQMYVHFYSNENVTKTGFLLRFKEDADDCTPNPCLNGGTCSTQFFGYSCSDCSGYTGQNCQTNIDECSNQVCDILATCRNIPGSFVCTCNPGYAGDGFNCTDVNECETGDNNCDRVNGACENTNGSWSCSCLPGYMGSGVSCQDIDECALDLHNCQENASCQNLAGGFTCVCVTGFTGSPPNCADIDECVLDTHSCHANATCSNEPVGNFSCTCSDGFTGDGIQCVDINECAQNGQNCHSEALCINTQASFECRCQTGYTGNGTFCEDVNECVLNLHDCHENASCANDPSGTYTCTCNNGLSGNGTECEDVNECHQELDDCHVNASCLNEPVGSFTCVCNTGYTGDGRNCEDVAECELGLDNCPANSVCIDVPSSFACMCTEGFTGDGRTCEDINECESGQNNCHSQADCMNLLGSFACRCSLGFTGNGTQCHDIDECRQRNSPCLSNAECMNSPGTFLCACIAGYTGDGRNCTALPPHPIPGVRPDVQVSQYLTSGSRQNQFAVGNPCISLSDYFSETYHEIVNVEVIVRETASSSAANIGTWATSIDQTTIGPYIAEILMCTTISSRVLTSDNQRFIVGRNTSCDRNQTSMICNGPLPPGRSLQVAFRSVVDGVMSPLTEFSNEIRTEKEPTCDSIFCDRVSVCQMFVPDRGQNMVAECVCTTSNCSVACSARNITDRNGNILQFPKTLAGLVAYSETRCQFSNQPIAFIPCVSQSIGGLRYGSFDVSKLSEITCTNTSITDILTATDVSAINSTELEQILLQLDTLTADVAVLSTGDAQATINFVNEINTATTIPLSAFSFQRVVEIGDHVTQYLPQNVNNEQSLENVTSFIQSLSELGFRLQLQNTTSNISVLTTGIAAMVKKIPNENAPVTYQPVLYDANGNLESPVSISIPHEAIALQMTEQNDTITGVFLVHTSNRLFPSDEVSSNSIVVSAQVRGNDGLTPTEHFQEPVLITYKEATNQGFNQNDSTLQAMFVNHTCVFWNFTLKRWSTEGCFLLAETRPPKCRCDHLTNFALLVSITEIEAHISLQIVSYVCASLSIVCLLCTLIALVVVRDIRKRRPVKILMNICAVLALVYLVFIIGVDKREHESGCVAVAMLLHYFLLTAWGWMVVYAHFLYMSVVKVFHTWSSHYLKKAAVLACGVPAIVVAINAIAVEATKQPSKMSPIYGREPPSAFVSSYLAENMCWIKGNSLYFSFLLPFGTMLLFNIVVFVLVMRELACKKRSDVDVQRTTSMKHHVKIAAMTGITLGICWFFAFFMMISDSQQYLTIMSWLFSIVVALQGVGIFLVTVVRKNEVQIGIRRMLQGFGCPCGLESFTSRTSSSQTQSSTPGPTMSTTN